jgi:hypothetical protein
VATLQPIVPCLWFDAQITAVTRYGDAGKEIHGRPAGSVMTVELADRAMEAMLRMKKLDIAALEAAFAG